jgi:CBS domain-containing protein
MRNVYTSDQPVAEYVKDLTSEIPLWFAPGEPIHEAVDSLIDNHKGAAGVLSSHNRLIGMITERQILRYLFYHDLDPMERMRVLFKELDHYTVRNVMIEEPVTLPASTPIERGLETITRHGFRYMPVVDDRDSSRYRGVVHVQELHMATREKYRAQLHRKDTLLTYFMHGDDYGGLHHRTAEM